MKGESRKHRYWRRRSWGANRSKVRQRFAKGDFEIEADFLRPHDSHGMWSHWDYSRMREKLERHPKRYRRTWLVDAVLGNLKGGDTSELERRFGTFYPRCAGCGKRAQNWNFFNRLYDEDASGLCDTCARPIIEERERRLREVRNARAMVLAEKLLPRYVFEDMAQKGWTSLRVRTMLVNDNVYSSPRDVEYRLLKDGRVYNATTRESYCIHPAERGVVGWCTIGFEDWDKVLELWLLLRQQPGMVERTAHKTPVPEHKWFKIFPPAPKKVVTCGGPLVLGIIDCRIPGRV